MESMGDRLREARKDAKHKSARSAAQHFGWTVSTYAAHENGQNDFDPPTASIYAKAFKTTAAYLLTGDGEKKAKRSVVTSFDPDVIEAGAGENVDETLRPNVFPIDAIRELVSKAGMGGGQTIETKHVRNGKEIVQQDPVMDDYWRIPPEFTRSMLGARPIDLLVLRGKGDSMVPTIMPEEPVIANTAHRKPSPDGLYAIRDDLGEIIVKRIELISGKPPRLRIISDNPKHSPQERGLDEVQIVGKVVLGLKLF